MRRNIQAVARRSGFDPIEIHFNVGRRVLWSVGRGKLGKQPSDECITVIWRRSFIELLQTDGVYKSPLLVLISRHPGV
jgi:hypothetical protein